MRCSQSLTENRVLVYLLLDYDCRVESVKKSRTHNKKAQLPYTIEEKGMNWQYTCSHTKSNRSKGVGERHLGE